MTWNPSDQELVRVWMAYNELHAEKRVGLNLATGRTRGIPTNARDFFLEITERAADLVVIPGARCINDPYELLGQLATLRGTTLHELYSSTAIDAEVRALKRVDRDRGVPGVDREPTLTEHAKEAVASTPRFLRTLWQTALSVVPMLLMLLAALGWLEDLEARRSVLIVGAIVYALITWHLLSGVLNPTEFFTGLKGSSGIFGDITPVGYVARSVSVLFFSFVVISYVAWDMTGGEFMVATRPEAVDWVMYGIDNVVRTLGLDLAETFRVDVSPIEHGEGWLPSAFVFTFRTTLGLSAISLVVEAVRRYPHWR